MDIPKYSAWLGRARIFRNGWTPQFMLLLDKINKEVEIYEKAFSPMAKRTIAMDLQERIAEFEKAWKKAYGIVPLPKELAELRAAALEQSGGMSISAHKYDYASCIAYKVGTGKFNKRLFSARWDGTDYQFTGIVEYAGKSTDQADAAMRLGRMKDAIKQGYALHHAEFHNDPKDAKTLKIFMAPEFFFRGINGAYDVSFVSGIFTELRNFIKDAKYKDWLFVFGTVIAASYDDRLACQNCGKTGASKFQRMGVGRYSCAGCPPGSVGEVRFGARIDNIALVQKGGEPDDKNSYVVEKEYVSHVDFRRHVNLQTLRAGKAATGHSGVALLNDWDADRRIELRGRTVEALPPTGSRDVGGSASKFADERMGGAVFSIDGIKFGLEICLDHFENRLAGNSGVQIQLVPSAGAFLHHFSCVPNGIAFNVDGSGHGACDVRINDSGAEPANSATVNASSSSIPGGGEVVVYAPYRIPWA